MLELFKLNVLPSRSRIYYKYQDSYAFIVDKNGYAIMHPAYSRPRSSSSSAYRFSTDIKYLEQMPGFLVVRERMLKCLLGGIEPSYGSETVNGEKNGVPKSVKYKHDFVLEVVCLIFTL